MSDNSQTPDSPCIGYCSCSLGDAMCKGCGRSLTEVDNWLFYTEAQKIAVWQRVNQLDTIRNRRKN
ncbi:MAG: DUF1289 domain-containing protein [Sulfuriferula sp.]